MDLQPGGEWNLVMHGPDGTDYPNRKVFLEFEGMRNTGEISDEVMRRVERDLDLEVSRLDV